MTPAPCFRPKVRLPLLDLRVRDHLAPLHDVVLQTLLDLFRRAAARVDTHFERLLADLRVGEHFVQRLVERRDDVGGRACRYEDRVP